MQLVPVDHDPFADAKAPAPNLVPVDHDPFADQASLPKAKFNGGVDAPAAGLPGDESAAVGRGIINGVPIVGPYILGGINRAAAGIRALQNDTRYSDELKRVEAFGEATEKANPWSTTGGEFLGGAVATAPLVAAAPAAFGISGAGLPVRTLMAGGSNAALGAADAAVRSGGELDAIKDGAVIGGALGAASPFAGRVAGKVVSAITGGGKGQGAMREALEGVSEKDLESARFLIEQARDLPGGGMRLTLDEALNAVTGGQATRASQLARVVTHSGGEGSRIMNEFYAARPASVENVGRAAFDGIGPQNPAPTGLGLDVQAAARAGMAQTAEGQALGQARAAQLPRTTPEQAGQAIQGDLGGVRALREAARDARGNVDYLIARNAPENFGVERTIQVERLSNEPVITYPNAPPRFSSDAPQPLGPAPGVGPAAGAARQPEGFTRWLARNGGVPMDGDVLGQDLNRVYVPGFGTLARREAPTWDQIRVRLMEEGYRPSDWAATAREADVRDFVMDQVRRERMKLGSAVRADDEAATFANRRGQDADEYRNALSTVSNQLDEALDRVGVAPASLHPEIRSRTLNALMGDPRLDPLDAYENVVGAMRDPYAPYVKTPTVTEQIPDVRFGQVNPQPAIDAIDRQISTAKGEVASELRTARKMLFHDGEPEMRIEGLHNARKRLDRSIRAADDIGDPERARDLVISRRAVDGQLKMVPEMATADANFARLSIPLEPFERGNAPLNRITARVDRPGAEPGPFRMPAEQVPEAINGPTALREALANGGPATRAAAERHLSTSILDSVTGADGNVSADALRSAMRQHADVLDQLPAVRDRLSNLVVAREGLARVEKSPLGRVAGTDDHHQAIKVLFASNPDAGSHGEVAAAMQRLAANNPRSARDLSRIYMETVFNEATQQTKGMAALYGGAGFASAVRGNPQQRHNLEAVVRALPEGDTIWRGLDRMLTTLEATGYRPVKGSDTAFNTAIQERLRNGTGPLATAITEAATNAAAGGGLAGPGGAVGGAMVGVKKAVGHAWGDRKKVVNGEALARLLTDPLALPDLRALAKSPPGSKNAELFTQRLLTYANGSGAPVRSPAAR